MLQTFLFVFDPFPITAKHARWESMDSVVVQPNRRNSVHLMEDLRVQRRYIFPVQVERSRHSLAKAGSSQFVIVATPVKPESAA